MVGVGTRQVTQMELGLVERGLLLRCMGNRDVDAQHHVPLKSNVNELLRGVG